MIIPIPPKSHRRRIRVKAAAANPPPPVAVTVVSVVWIDEQHAQWSFSLPVVSIENGSGLVVGGQEPDAYEVNDGGIFTSYSSGVSVDDPWSIDPFPPVSITFAGGGTLVVPESGNVV